MNPLTGKDLTADEMKQKTPVELEAIMDALNKEEFFDEAYYNQLAEIRASLIWGSSINNDDE